MRELEALLKAAEAAKNDGKEDKAKAKALGEKLKTCIDALQGAIKAEIKAHKGVLNIDNLLKQANMTDLKTEKSGMNFKLESQKKEAAMLRYFVDAAEKKLLAFDRDAVENLQKTRKNQSEKLKAQLKEEFDKLQQRAKKASLVNADRLREMQPTTLKKHKDSLSTREESVSQFTVLGKEHGLFD